MQRTVGVKRQVIPELNCWGQIPALYNTSWAALARSLCLHVPICKLGHLWTCLIGLGGELEPALVRGGDCLRTQMRVLELKPRTVF